MGISRSEARQKAFELIFQNSVNSAGEALEAFALSQPELAQNSYIHTVVEGVEKNIDVIDELISSNLSAGRSITRLSRVVITVLRLAVFEIKYMDDVPPAVAANEAVELAKKYGDDREPQYVNGVLSGVIKSL